mgnify:CR=1 FL=1
MTFYNDNIGGKEDCVIPKYIFGFYHYDKCSNRRG